jgi:hypothetical protein
MVGILGDKKRYCASRSAAEANLSSRSSAAGAADAKKSPAAQGFSQEN